jgi:dihydroorotase
MQLKSIEWLELPPTADMHAHLRQSKLMELVAPTVRNGGVDTVFVYAFPSGILKRNERANQGV